MWFWICGLAGALAQPHPSAETLQAVHQQATHVEQVGMVVLGGWASLNIVGGVVGALHADDPALQAFHQGNAAWNVVNLGIAVPGYLSARRRAQQPPVWPALPVDLAQQRGIFLLNLGLDVGYIGVGTSLWALRPTSPRQRGYGQALVLQGAFLGAFDLTLARLNARSARPLKPYLSPDSVGVVGRF